MIDRATTLPTACQVDWPPETETCDYCHLPLAGRVTATVEPAYCCVGCRLAAEITGQSGQRGAMHWTLVRLGLAIFLSLNVMMFTMALWTQDLYDARASGSGPLAASLADLLRYLCLLLSLPVLFLLGGPLWDNARGLGRRDVAAADLLILVGVVASYLYSVISVVRGAGHVYFEVGCAVLIMVTLGRWLEATGKLKTTEALDSLQKLLPKQVRVTRQAGRDAQIDLDQLRVGDHMHVLAGERIATDGRLVAGRASVDQQVLTGESRPVVKQQGDEVFGGGLNLDGDLLVEVTVPPRAGSLARLVELVRQARLTKGRYQRLADRVASWFLSFVIIVALAVFVFHAWRGGLDQGLMAGLAVLLIACPCALGLATPMAVWTALGTAARAGVLFRHGEALERLATVRAVRFDKTGTLTSNTPEIKHFVAADPSSRADVLCRAARLAGGSRHVFSIAIARFAASDTSGGALPHFATHRQARWSGIRTSSGRGVFAQLENEPRPTYLGSLRWLAESGLEIDRALAAAADQASHQGEPVSAIGWGGCVRGLFVFSESLRPEARAALAACETEGCDVEVLSGDNPRHVAALARRLAVPVRAGLLPEEKVAAIAEARARWGPVAMVGDGINDAPSLAASDLGIAMGCGADVSRESAGVCLMGDDLRRVPWAIDLARRTVRVMRQNLFWAFSYNTLGICLAAGGWLNPAWAALAMLLSSSLVVTNSLRLAGQPQPLLTTVPLVDRDENDPAVTGTIAASPLRTADQRVETGGIT